jgi:hypothetical protein
MLAAWCLGSGLWCILANSALLLMGLDPAPYKARGRRALAHPE